MLTCPVPVHLRVTGNSLPVQGVGVSSHLHNTCLTSGQGHFACIKVVKVKLASASIGVNHLTARLKGFKVNHDVYKRVQG